MLSKLSYSFLLVCGILKMVAKDFQVIEPKSLRQIQGPRQYWCCVAIAPMDFKSVGASTHGFLVSFVTNPPIFIREDMETTREIVIPQ